MREMDDYCRLSNQPVRRLFTTLPINQMPVSNILIVSNVIRSNKNKEKKAALNTSILYSIGGLAIL
jgi:hypothetical protein